MVIIRIHVHVLVSPRSVIWNFTQWPPHKDPEGNANINMNAKCRSQLSYNLAQALLSSTSSVLAITGWCRSSMSVRYFDRPPKKSSHTQWGLIWKADTEDEVRFTTFSGMVTCKCMDKNLSGILVHAHGSKEPKQSPHTITTTITHAYTILTSYSIRTFGT